jgi:hypothetical protein
VFEDQEDKQKAHGNPEADVSCRKRRSPHSQGDSGAPLLMTIPTAARRAGIGVRQLRRAVQLNDVKAVMVGSWPRVYWDSVVGWLYGQRVRPTEDVKRRVAESLERRGRRLPVHAGQKAE